MTVTVCGHCGGPNLEPLFGGPVGRETRCRDCGAIGGAAPSPDEIAAQAAALRARPLFPRGRRPPYRLAAPQLRPQARQPLRRLG